MHDCSIGKERQRQRKEKLAGKKEDRTGQKWRPQPVSEDNYTDGQLLKRGQVCSCHWDQRWSLSIPEWESLVSGSLGSIVTSGPCATRGLRPDRGPPATGTSWHSVQGPEQEQRVGLCIWRWRWVYLLQSKNIFYSFLKEMTHLKEVYIS